ncbi:LOW QUALITY PROTEIN: hypothetical protein PHMEG_0004417 [Phytophthora megakarya]|uniref:ApaG domain-containing protein n=1 Tax=Phytophthora megakarya TaxID=4795 RepID=A0A225WTT1_9STRA|nr:LOW QUALITY PROTEIN: hypothetical protein PHMEG_0004417 [Phytophthora megakarya]
MPSSATVRAIYRCLLRDARELQRTPHFNVRRALQLEQWGTGGYVEPLPQEDASPKAFESLEQFQKLRDVAFRKGPPSVDIIKSIQRGFRQNLQLSDPKVTKVGTKVLEVASAKLDEAIEVLSELSEQLLLAQCSSVTVTDGIRIEATSKYLEGHSNPTSNTYRFTYRVTITNQSEITEVCQPDNVSCEGVLTVICVLDEECSVQILGRQYTFESEKGQRISLPRNSPGIVGATPVLAPGQTFEYASGVDIDAPRGSVVGCLHVVRKDKSLEDEDGELFDAFVSKFALLAPRTR